jgi:hypothetical protein
MEQMMRIVSWSVILGAAVALWFGGIRPMLPEGLLPEVDPTGVSGTVARERKAGVCTEALEESTVAREPADANAEPCHEKVVTQN